MSTQKNGKKSTEQYVVEESLEVLKLPRLYTVFLINDDYTPMDFVIDVLRHIFCMDLDKAQQVMWDVHTKGRANCGVFTHDIAETRVYQVMEHASEMGYPLLCEMEAINE